LKQKNGAANAAGKEEFQKRRRDARRSQGKNGNPLKIAILGTRGIPANYGGFETFAEECGAGLVSRGHHVTVYGRSRYVSGTLKTHRGVRLVVLPTVEWKYTDTLFPTFISTIHALFQEYDLILICNAANSIYAWLPRILGTPVVVNVDGIERLRQKWNWAGKAYYHLCEYLSTCLPNIIVTDARVIENYYRDRYGASSVFIPYGARSEKAQRQEILEKLGLIPGEYFLYVSRLEPENNAHLVVKAFERIRSSKRLAIVGNAPYAAKYIQKVRATRDPRILFAGAVYGEGYWQLQSHAFCYIHATEVGGTHPALIEAMGQGNLVIANETPENAETLGSTGILYRKNDADDLTRCIQDVEDHPENYAKLRTAALERARSAYSWDRVIEQYEQLFANLLKRRWADGRH
jgi:glycosyltransferase involved in cell wall biosynthesis